MASIVPPDEPTQPGTLSIRWSAVYAPQWDDTPQAYVDAGVVGSGRSRRLAKAEDASRAFKAYLGVQHWDPTHWNLPGEERAVFFLSLFRHNRTLSLRTFPTLSAARDALDAAWQSLA
jgi:hypothetical protein